MVSEYVVGLLDHAGYTFHEGDLDNTGRTTWWYVWGFPNGTCDYETGPDCVDIHEARLSALIHFLQNARILTEEEERALHDAGLGRYK